MNTILILAALFGPLAADGAPDDGQIQGRPLRHWIDMLKDSDVLGREETLEVLMQAGPAARPALPAVRQLLQDKQVTVRFRAALALWKIGGEATLVVPVMADMLRSDADQNLRLRAVQTLGQLNGAAAAVAPVLVTHLNDNNELVRRQVAAALEQLGTAALPALTKGAEAGSLVRREAIDALGKFGARAAEAVPTLTAALGDTDSRTRIAAALALSRVDRKKTAVAVLVEGLKSDDPATRNQAADILFAIRPRPRQATDGFVDALKSSDLRTRIRAADALWDLRGNPEEVLPALTEGVGTIDFGARGWALETVRRMGPKARPILPVLVEKLGAPGHATPDFVEAFVAIGPEGIAAAITAFEQNPGLPKQGSVVKMQAMMVLGLSGSEGVEALGKLASHPHPLIRGYVAGLLAEMGRTAPEKALAILAELLKDKDRGVRLATLLAYGSLGPAVGEAPAAVLDLLKDPDPSIRTNALTALENMRLDAKTLPVMEEIAARDAIVLNRILAMEHCWRLDAKKHPAAEVVRDQIKLNQPLRSLDFMARIGPGGRDAVPQVITLLGPQQPYLRQKIVDILVPFGADAKAAAPVLVEQLKDPQAYFRVEAALALVQIGDAGPALPILAATVKDSSLPVSYHQRIHAALRKLGADAGPVLPALRQVTSTPDTSIFRVNCALTLARLDPGQKDAAIAALTAVMAGTTSPVHLEAAAAVLDLDRSNGRALRVLVQGLADFKPDNRQVAAQKLGRLGADARPALPALRDAVLDDVPGVRFTAAAACWKVARDAGSLAILTDAVKTPSVSSDARAHAITLLGELDDVRGDGKEVVPVLVQALRDRHPSVRGAAVKALKIVDPETARKAGY